MQKVVESQTSIRAIGHRLLLTRQAVGLGQSEFCARAKIKPNTYNQYEKGRFRPTIDNAIALCETYNLTLDWIYRGNAAGLRYDMAEAIRALRTVRS
jgi:transcriptional regulator with XRE-family HTH domain